MAPSRALSSGLGGGGAIEPHRNLTKPYERQQQHLPHLPRTARDTKSYIDDDKSRLCRARFRHHTFNTEYSARSLVGGRRGLSGAYSVTSIMFVFTNRNTQITGTPFHTCVHICVLACLALLFWCAPNSLSICVVLCCWVVARSAAYLYIFSCMKLSLSLSIRS